MLAKTAWALSLGTVQRAKQHPNLTIAQAAQEDGSTEMPDGMKG
jgi:hypothetical protein